MIFNHWRTLTFMVAIAGAFFLQARGETKNLGFALFQVILAMLLVSILQELAFFHDLTVRIAKGLRP